MKEKHKYQELTGNIIGAAMEVHRHLGNGFTHIINLFLKGIRECFAFQEVVYQRALAIELDMRKINFVREMEMPLKYKGFDIGIRRVDFFIEEKIMLEIKAVIQLENVDLAQAINYLEAYDMEIGLLINFGSPSLQFKRVMKPQRNNSQS
jgi:GxxExxY protein